MKAYTVVLLRPDYMHGATETTHGQDIYVAHIPRARDEYHAVTLAQREVHKADRKDKLEPQSRDDYALCVMFEGIQEVARFGWQA